jgi:hypothetical protein
LLFVQWSHSSPPPELHLLLAYLQITIINQLWNDVAAVLQLEVNQIELAVLDFIDGRFFAGIAMDVGKRIVMENGRHLEWFPALVPVLEFKGRGFYENLVINVIPRHLGQYERIDVAAGTDEVQVGNDPFFGWLDVAEVLGTVDNPVFLVDPRIFSHLQGEQALACGDVSVAVNPRVREDTDAENETPG